QALAERGPVGVVRDGVVERDVGDDGGLAVEHGPAADARRHGEPLTLPQRGDGVLVDVVAAVAVAEDEGGAVGPGEPAGGPADDLAHGDHVAGHGEPLHDLDQAVHARGDVGNDDFGLYDRRRLPVAWGDRFLPSTFWV